MKRNDQIWHQRIATCAAGITVSTLAILLGTMTYPQGDRLPRLTTFTEEQRNSLIALKGIVLNGQSFNRLSYDNSDWIQPNTTLVTVKDLAVQAIRLEDGQLVLQLEEKTLQSKLSQ